MPIYEYEGQFYDLKETDKDAAKAKIQAHLGQSAKEESWLDKLKGTPSWMVSKPGQGWDDANAQAAGGDVTNPMAYLSEAQKTEQGPAMQATGQVVNRLLQQGAGVAKGAIINPVAAVAQVVPGETGRQFAEQAQKAYDIQRQNAGEGYLGMGRGFDLAELVGAVASPVNRMLPGGGYAGGAFGAMTQPVEGENLSYFDVLSGKAKQAASGALLGKFAENVIAGLTPKLKAGTQELIDKGIPVSPGQAYEGAPGWLFRQIEALGLGPKAKTVNEAFNKSVGNEVLSTIGQTLPETVAPGHAAVRLTQRRISNFYDESLNAIGKNPLDKEYKDGVAAVIKSTLGDIADKDTRDLVQKRLVNSLNANIGSRLKNGQIEGSDLKAVQEWLKGEVNKYSGKTGVVPESLKSSYADILANLNQYISRVDTAGNIAKADAAWAKLYSYADAAGKATKTGGVFSPEQLASAAASQAETTLTKGGAKAPLADVAQEAIGVLGTQKESSLPAKLFMASKIATGAATTWAAPAVAIPILTAAGMTYAAAKQLMKNPSATRLAVQKALENNPGLFGSLGQNLINQMTRENQ